MINALSIRIYFLNLKLLNFIVSIISLLIILNKFWSLGKFLCCLDYSSNRKALIGDSWLYINIFWSSLWLNLCHIRFNCILLNFIFNQNLNRYFNKDDFFDFYFFDDFYGFFYLNNPLNYYLIRYWLLWLYASLFGRLIKSHKWKLFSIFCINFGLIISIIFIDVYNLLYKYLNFLILLFRSFFRLSIAVVIVNYLNRILYCLIADYIYLNRLVYPLGFRYKTNKHMLNHWMNRKTLRLILYIN